MWYVVRAGWEGNGCNGRWSGRGFGLGVLSLGAIIDDEEVLALDHTLLASLVLAEPPVGVANVLGAAGVPGVVVGHSIGMQASHQSDKHGH